MLRSNHQGGCSLYAVLALVLSDLQACSPAPYLPNKSDEASVSPTAEEQTHGYSAASSLPSSAKSMTKRSRPQAPPCLQPNKELAFASCHA